jgi:hypothetical protein
MIDHYLIGLIFLVLTLVVIYVFIDFTLSLFLKAAANFGIKGVSGSKPVVVKTFQTLFDVEKGKDQEREAKKIIDSRG